MPSTCETCGARIDAGETVCSLCGTPLEEAAPSSPSPDSLGDVDEGAPIEDHDAEQTLTPQCDTCGQENPEGSRFCNRCGARLVPSAAKDTGGVRTATVPAALRTDSPAEDSERSTTRSGITDLDASDRAVGKQVIIVVSAALLLVVILYAVTAMSGGAQGDFSVGQVTETEQAVEPLASQWQDREAELKAEVDDASGPDQIDARRRLIDLYFAADRLDVAAEQTALIAEATGAEEDWIRTGNLYFDWMQRSASNGKARWAQQAVAAYQRALDLNPENLDVRTDMAIAYLYDPQNSMMAIQETNKVLSSDSMHVQANFNRGIMLSQINRLDAAIEQFEKVKRIVGNPDDPVYQRAVDAITRLSER